MPPVPYRPAVSNENAALRVTALVGSHSAILGFDLVDESARDGLLGFAIRRTDRTLEEAHWLTGQLRFPGDTSDYGDDIPTIHAPIQKFHWGDYALRPGHVYDYEVHALYGKPGALQRRHEVKLSVRATTGNETEPHIYFNRGVTATIAYRRRFGDVDPRKVTDGSAARWLSRGLEEALLQFIDGAAQNDELKVAIFEYEHEGVIEALRRARARGVRVRILYHAKSTGSKSSEKQVRENRKAVAATQLGRDMAIARTAVPRLSHNKFIVLSRGNAPRAVWTGSTNFTDAGFYFQTNFGLVFTDAAVVESYNSYFEDVLWPNPEGRDARERIERLVRRANLFFSPTRNLGLLERACEMIGDAQETVLLSCPFGLDGSVTDALIGNHDRIVEYGLVNTTSYNHLIAQVGTALNSQYAAPRALPRLDGRVWDAKAYGQHKVHVKSIVVDPWTAPRVLLGSANFSDESVRDNDENALYVEDDGRLAAIAATEFLRMFDHYRIRHMLADVQKKKRGTGRAPAGRQDLALLQASDKWTAKYFVETSPQFRRRQVFAQRIRP